MGKRIYLVQSAYDDANEPYVKMGYWDEDTGQITRVATNIDYDLGAGYFCKDADGNIYVIGPREMHYVPTSNILDFGDYWDNEEPVDEEDLTSDIIIYKLDPDLQNPAHILTDGVAPDGNYNAPDEGWQPQSLYPFVNQFDNQNAVPYLTRDGRIAVAGYRYVNYDVDYRHGFMFHLYEMDGTLVRRGLKQSGQGPEGDNSGAMDSLDVGMQWSAYDSVRNFMYYFDDWGVWRYDITNDTSVYAPAVFPVWSAFQNQPYYQVENFIDRPDYLVQGPMPYNVFDPTNPPTMQSPAYAYANERDYWRSRWCHGFDVDERTGYLWGLVQGYEPLNQEYARPGDGTPLSTGPGGFGAPGEKWQLICIDFDAMQHTIEGTDANRDNPYPGPVVPGGEWDVVHGALAGPLQMAADVRIIDITHGKEHVALAADDPLRPGYGLRRHTQSDSTHFTPALADFEDSTGVTLTAGTPLTLPLDGLKGGATAADFIDGEHWFLYLRAPGSTGVIDVTYTGASGTHSVLTFDSAVDGDQVFHDFGPPSEEFKSDLVAGGVTFTLTLTSGASVFVAHLVVYVSYEYSDPNEGAQWDFVHLALPKDEPGFAYYVAQVPYHDADLPYYTQRNTYVWATYRINLDTGVATEVFRDLGRETAWPDDTSVQYLMRMPMVQVLPAGATTVVVPTPFGPNILANLLDTGQRFL